MELRGSHVIVEKKEKEQKQQQFVLIRVFFCILHGSLISRNYHIVVGVDSCCVALCCWLLPIASNNRLRPRLPGTLQMCF